jgi:uncharacterized membrane protein
MNKLDFLRKLDRELSVLDKEERKEILHFYEERFYTGTIYENKTEEQVIADLERPEVIARNVLEEYGVSPKYVKSSEERYTNVSLFRVIMLIAFDVLIASSVIPALFSAAIAIIGSSFSFVATIPMIINDPTTVDEFVFAFIAGGYVLLFLFGLVVLEASLWLTRTLVKWHLNVFKMKNRDKMIKKVSRWSLDSWFKKHRGARRVKNIALVGALVTVIYTGFWIFNHYDWVEAEYGRGEVINETFTEDFTQELLNNEEWSIITDFENMEITVVKVAGNDFVVKHSYYEDDEFEYEFDYENNELTISNDTDDTINFFFDPSDIFRAITSDYEIRIEVPEDLVLDTGVFETYNGEITINNVDFKNFAASTSNGTVYLANLTVENDVDITTSNGTIDLNNVLNVNLGLVKLSTSNGSIEIRNANFGTYDISTSNGKVTLFNLNEDEYDGLELEVDTSNGSIQLKNVYIDDIDLDTSNGSIEFLNDDTSFHPTSYKKSTSLGEITTNVTE